MEQAIMATGVVLVGLVTLGLVAQVMHQVTIRKALRKIQVLEDRILARLLILTEQETMVMGTPATLEDLIQMDLMEQMGQTAPMTDRRVKEMVEEITAMEMTTMDTTPATPDVDTVAPTETLTEPTKTVSQDVRVTHPDGTSKVYSK